MKPVYYYPLNDNPSIGEQSQAIRALIEASRMDRMIAPRDFVAIKLHVGEEHNTTHIKPELIKTLVDACSGRDGNVFLTETSTLYRGERENAVKHLLHAQRHGFGIERVGAPFIMADGLTGGSEVEVRIDGELETTVKIAREVALTDVLIAVSHPTGHIDAGLGACLKNLGMGLASRAGKLRQHSSVQPKVKPAKCCLCRKCMRWCPQDAIVAQERSAVILAEKCIGCGECLTVCRYGAISHDWETESEPLQKRMVEYAFGAIKDKREKCFYFNVLVGMTENCDCFAVNQPKLVPDLGILASGDPVAIDKATLDLTARANGRSLAELAHGNLNAMLQLEHGAKLGMGSLEYELVTIK